MRFIEHLNEGYDNSDNINHSKNKSKEHLDNMEEQLGEMWANCSSFIGYIDALIYEYERAENAKELKIAQQIKMEAVGYQKHLTEMRRNKGSIAAFKKLMGKLK